MKQTLTKKFLDNLNYLIDKCEDEEYREYLLEKYKMILKKEAIKRLIDAATALSEDNWAALYKMIGHTPDGRYSYISFQDVCGVEDIEEVLNEMVRDH